MGMPWQFMFTMTKVSKKAPSGKDILKVRHEYRLKVFSRP